MSGDVSGFSFASSSGSKYDSYESIAFDDCRNNFVSPDYIRAKVGDLIEFRRDVYNHWGIYVGDGYVINFVNMATGKGVVKRELLVDVTDSSLVRVNNLEVAAQRRGLYPKDYKTVLKLAFSKLGNEIEYDLFEYNCEHFVTECYYGSGFSEQTDNVIGSQFVSFMSSAFNWKFSS